MSRSPCPPHPDTDTATTTTDTDDELTDDVFAALEEADEADDAPEVSEVSEGVISASASPDAPAPAAPSTPVATSTPLPAESARAPFALPFTPHLSVQPRQYQSEAVAAWLRQGARGIVVLPTGAGKTIVAFDAMAQLGVRTLVVVPTIELLRQWHAGVIERLQAPEEAVGVVGGGERTVGPITIITYDSAAMPRRKLAGYGLLIFDEAHHLPAQSYRAIVKKCPAPWRLGLSATLERADGRHAELFDLIGPLVYERGAEELSAARHIAAYRERRVFVDLSPDEELRYEALMGEWKWYL
ncbi:MAG: DEAD/DEAH box helicase, partial [Ktedonobacterales bacterium]